METPFVLAMITVAATLLIQTTLIGRWVGKTGEKVDNLVKRQDIMSADLEAVKVEQGVVGKGLSRLQGLFNGRHEGA